MLSQLQGFGFKGAERLRDLKLIVQKVGVVGSFLLFKTLARQRFLERRLGRLYLNPFTGFVLSNWFVSSEVVELRLRHLNFSSKKLNGSNATRVREGSIIFIQVDELHYFFDEILPKIRTKFFLITGKFHGPGLEFTSYTKEIGEDPRVVLWFSQNQVHKELNAIPFPYGLNFYTLRELDAALKNSRLGVKLETPFVPFSGIHPHLKGDALRIRSDLKPLMAPLSPLEEYYEKIKEHRFVVSPPGDRPDTYRHYECIALGAYPVSSVPASFRRIFGDNMLYSDNLVAVASANRLSAMGSPDPNFVRTKFWRDLVKKMILDEGRI